MKKTRIQYCLMLIGTFLFCLQLASALPYYYNISMHYKSGNLEVKEINIAHSERELSKNTGDYLIKVLDKNNKILSENHFQIPLVEIYDNLDNDTGNLTSEVKNLDEAFFNIFIHYNYGEKMIIYDYDNNEIKNFMIDDFLNTTNNKNNNNEVNNIDINNNNAKRSNLILYIIIILSLVIVFVLIFFLIKKYRLK